MVADSEFPVRVVNVDIQEGKVINYKFNLDIVIKRINKEITNKEDHINYSRIAKNAGIAINLIFDLKNPNKDRTPRLDVVLKILYAVNYYCKLHNVKLTFGLDSILEYSF